MQEHTSRQYRLKAERLAMKRRECVVKTSISEGARDSGTEVDKIAAADIRGDPF
jgi:hypothetical protein